MNKEMGPFEHLDTTIYLVFSPISSHLVAIPGPKLFNKITTYERSLAAKYIFVREIELQMHAMLVWTPLRKQRTIYQSTTSEISAVEKDVAPNTTKFRVKY